MIKKNFSVEELQLLADGLSDTITRQLKGDLNESKEYIRKVRKLRRRINIFLIYYSKKEQ